MGHVALLGERSECSAHEADGVGIGDFQGRVERLVTNQALGVKMLAVPGNSVIHDDVDRVDDGVGDCGHGNYGGIRFCRIFRKGKRNQGDCQQQ